MVGAAAGVREVSAYAVRAWALGWLTLDGPFCYPRWVGEQSGAAMFTFAQAHQWRQAYGGEVVRVG